MKKITLAAVITILALAALGRAVNGAEPRSTSYPAEAPDIGQTRSNIEKRLAAAVDKADAQASVHWAQALAALDTGEFLRGQTEAQAPIVGILKAFKPQIEAVPALIKSFVVEEITRNTTTPRMRELLGKFFSATSSTETVPLAHGFAHTAADENKASRRFWELRSDYKAKNSFAVALGLKTENDMSSEQEEQWARICKERAVQEITAQSNFDPAEKLKVDTAKAAADAAMALQR